MKTDYAEVSDFCSILYPSDSISFETFSKQNPSVERKFLHGSLSQHWDELVYLNSAGADVFAMVNTGDGRGRKTENVVELSGIFVDLDGSPVDPLLDCPIPPHVIL